MFRITTARVPGTVSLRVMLIALTVCAFAACDAGEDGALENGAGADTEVTATEDPTSVEVTLSEILAAPQNWNGRTRTISGRVDSVEAGNRFWLQSQNERVLVILQDVPASSVSLFDSGFRVTVRDGTIVSNADSIPEDIELDDDARAAVDDQPLVVVAELAKVEQQRDATSGRPVIEMETTR